MSQLLEKLLIWLIFWLWCVQNRLIIHNEDYASTNENQIVLEYQSFMVIYQMFSAISAIRVNEASLSFRPGNSVISILCPVGPHLRFFSFLWIFTSAQILYSATKWLSKLSPHVLKNLNFASLNNELICSFVFTKATLSKLQTHLWS